ncbi:hypothetical protein [Streptomyces sp. JJ36]|uniref:hypothetical protein n=1 Tax=Streptomyces sp. JJ36 TaxID=2736645 RepID=UPI001F42C307|nr:hypothetical protein [Streptomyces sp. JJ36]MCF6521964.1 hypothetical protein [Streptomyces sp. JJ36]
MVEALRITGGVTGECDAFTRSGSGVGGELAALARRPCLNPSAGVLVSHAVLAAAGEHRALAETGIPRVEGALVETRDSGSLLGELDPAWQSSKHVYRLAHLAQGTERFPPSV